MAMYCDFEKRKLNKFFLELTGPFKTLIVCNKTGASHIFTIKWVHGPPIGSNATFQH